MNEFDLIRTFFERPGRMGAAGAVDLGIGDDCALLSPRAGMQWAVSSDMLVQGRHFFADVDPRALGHKALAVNLSDLAAMGATPVAFTLALALPHVDEVWLQAFSEGLLALADAHTCALVGGDTTAGPLTLSITVFGEVPSGSALQRSGAKVGDDIYVSGDLGWARLGLAHLNGDVTLPSALLAKAVSALNWPEPRLALGLALRGVAHAAIDISDGLAGDLGHILRRSGVGAVLHEPALVECLGPLAAALGWPPTQIAQWVLDGGDDYELCWTAPPSARSQVASILTKAGANGWQRVGTIQAQPGLMMQTTEGALRPVVNASFQHF